MHRQIAGSLTGPVTKWIVLVAVLILAGFLGSLGSNLADVKNNEQSSWVPASAESTKVADELSEEINPNDIPTLVVYHREGGLTEADFAAIDEDAAEIAKIDGVTDEGALSPGAARALREQGQPVPDLVSEDGEVAYIYFTFNLGKDGWNKIGDPVDDIRGFTEIDGVDVYVGGFGGQASDFIESFDGSHVSLLLITVGVVILILLFTYRSPVLWILPIICALVSNFAATGVVYLLAKYADLTVNDQSQYILSILVIGAGTDYALLLVARYREELRRHEDRHEAMAFALHRASPALLASAATVVVGLMCLSFADLNSTASLGPVLAVGVAVTVFVMLTLLPALLVIFGRWFFWPKRPAFGSVEPTQSGLWARTGRRIGVRPRMVWVVTAVILGVACLGLFKLDPSGLTSEESFTDELGSVTAQKLLSDHGLADNSNTLQVVANEGEIDEVRSKVEGLDDVGTAGPTTPLGDGRAYFEAPLQIDYASQAAFDVVEQARDDVHAVDGADALVGGGAAFYLDTKTASLRDNKVIIPIVLLVVLLILIGLLRAVAAPVILVATVVLSFGAALGLSALLFEYVMPLLPFDQWPEHATTDPGFPLFAFVFLVALGVDYNIFLMTRVREETVDHGTRKGSLIALQSTGGVITSAGLVLAATFLVLGTLPFVFLAHLGTAVALGVLLDTMIVRSVLVTALNLDLGGKIWWPSKLDRTPGDDAPEPPPDTAQEQEKALV
jgi:RND superfamily putative drug exporter